MDNSNDKQARESKQINEQIEKQLRDDQIKAVKEMLYKSKKGALSLAVAFAISTTVTGCNSVNKPEDSTYYVSNSRSFGQQDTSESTAAHRYHYYGGGSYYYGRDATYRAGSWGSLLSSGSKSSGSTITSKSGLGGSSYRGAGG